MKTLILSPIMTLDTDLQGVITTIHHLPSYEEIVRLRGLSPLSLHSLLPDPQSIGQLEEAEIFAFMLEGIEACDQVLVCSGFDRCPIMWNVARYALQAGKPLISYEELLELDPVGMDGTGSMAIHLRKFWDDLNARFDNHFGWFFTNGYKALEKYTSETETAQ
jgi:hypothetical protein